MQKTSRPCALRQRRTLVVTLLTAVLAATTAHAATWTGSVTDDGLFSTTANWSDAASPAGKALTFAPLVNGVDTTLSNDLVGATYTGLIYNASSPAFTIAGNSFTLGTSTANSGNITNSSGSLQTINNNIALSNVAHTISAASGNIALDGNFSGATGSVIFSGSSTTTLSGTNAFNLNVGNFAAFTVGASAAAPGFVSITGATTTSSTGTASTAGGSLVIQGTSNLTIQTGGSLSVNAVSGTAGNSIIGQNATGTSTLLVNGGSLTVSGAQGFVIGNSNGTTTGVSGVLTISSGTATINRGTLGAANTGDQRLIEMGRDRSDASGTINLNGGTLATNRQFVRDGSSGNAASGTANFVFGGGTLKALGNQTDWLQSTTATSGGQGGGTVNASALALSSVTTTSALSTIDSNGFSVAINSAISGAGGFNITSSSGTGTVIFSGTNGYTGGTIISSGTFALTGTGSINSSSGISVATGATFSHGGSIAVTPALTLAEGSALAGSGSFTPGSLTVSANLADGFSAIAAASGLTKSGTLTFSLTNITAGDYSLFSGGTTPTGSFTGVSIASTGLSSADSNATFTGTDGSWSYLFTNGTNVLSVSAIPEPSTYAAFAGVLALGAVALRRRRRQA